MGIGIDGFETIEIAEQIRQRNRSKEKRRYLSGSPTFIAMEVDVSIFLVDGVLVDRGKGTCAST